MANLFRLILFWCAFAGSAHAVNIPPTLQPDTQEINRITSQYIAECNAVSNGYHSPCTSGPVIVGPTPKCLNSSDKTSCVTVNTKASGVYTYKLVPFKLGCPANYTLVGNECVPDAPPTCTANAELVNGVCMCKAGFKEGLGGCQFDTKGQCEAFAALETLPGGVLVKDIVLKGRVEDAAVFCMPLGSDAAMQAAGGCRVAFEQQMVASNHDGSTTSYGKWAMSSSPSAPGDYSCSTAEPSPPKQPDKPKCTNGAPGMVNGVEVCVPRQADNGVETGMKDEKSVNDGEKTTTTKNDATTVCKDGKCTTTTVTTTTVTNNTSGASTTSTSTSTATTGKDDFCGKNPKNAACNGTGTGTGGNGDGDEKDPSKFGGSCGAWTCEGDAIQCAMAREQHQRACKLIDDHSSAEAQLYEASKAKDGNQTHDLPGNATHEFGPGHFNTTDALGGGSCISDLTVDVLGKSVVLPTSKICPYVAWLKTILLAVGALLWMVIVFRG